MHLKNPMHKMAASDRKKLGYLIPQFPGQTHIFFWREIAELEKLGVQVRLFSTRRPPPSLIAHSWSEAAMARTEYLGNFRPGQALRTLRSLPFADWMHARERSMQLGRDMLLCLSAARNLAQSCAREGIDHVHVHSCGRAALIAALAHRAYGLKYSLTLHGPLSDYGPGQRFKWRYASFATVITQKLLDEVRDALAPDLPPNIVIQPMGVDTDALMRKTPYLSPAPGEQIRLFSCGRLNMVKGHQDLMQAVRNLLDNGLDTFLEIAGEDDDGGNGYRKELELRITELQLTDHVRLLGAIDADHVKRKLLAAHFFVLASWNEPLGVALMEAMSCGIPTIGTAAGGVPELILDGRDGILVPPSDPASLAKAIRSLVADPQKCKELSLSGRARIVSSFQSVRGAETLLRETARASGYEYAPPLSISKMRGLS